MKYILSFFAALFMILPWQAHGHGECVCVAAGNWSDPATWGGTVPDNGAHVTIPMGMMVHLDTNTAALGSITVEGHLEVTDTADRTITAGHIIVQHGGIFSAGTVTQPFAHKLTVTLTGTNQNAVPGMGGRLLGAHHGSRITLIGATPAINWTFLNATAAKGANTITLDQAPGWKTGDEIIITSTDYDYAQTEKRTIVGIADKTITLNAPLNYLHYGQITQINHGRADVPNTIDERAEVGLLTHNIKIQGAADSETAGFGGHTMLMDTSVAHLRGVEFYRMGQKAILGRYPMHWHDVNDAGANSFMENCSVHHSFNRGTTIHKTNNLRISGNVIYDTLGHGYFFEDGKETGSTLTRNLVAFVHKGALDTQFLKHGFQQPNGDVPACYWISNPNNHFIDNAAAGQTPGGIGFWFDLHDLPRPGSITAAADPNYNPKIQPAGVFRGNRAHSGTSPTQFNSQEPGWGLFVEHGGAVIENFTAFKNQKGQIWTAGGSTVQNSRLAGDMPLFNPSVLKNSLVIGRTPNPILVEPVDQTWLVRGFELEWSFAGKLQMADLALEGYDALPAAENCVFGNYRGIFRLRKNPVAGGETANCTFLNDAPYRTYYIANPDNYDAASAENSQFARDERGDGFGNGSSGFFTYTRTLTDERSKNFQMGGKGIEPTDPLLWWTPGRIIDFFAFQVQDPATSNQPFTSPFGVMVQHVGMESAILARITTDFNSGYVHESNTKPGLVNKLTFTGTVQNETIVLRVRQGPKQKGVFLLYTLPVWGSGTPTFYSEREDQWGGRGQAAHRSTTKAEFDASTTTTYFVDQSLIHVKVDSTDPVFRISNYTPAGPNSAAQLYSQWLSGAFTQAQVSDPAFSAATSDPQKDGVPNGIEYVLATAPGTADQPPTTFSTAPAAGGPRPSISFRRVEPIRDGTTLVVEQSADLVNWSPIATAAAGSTWSGSASVAEEAPVSGRVKVTVTSTTSISSANPKAFLRLRSVLPQ